MDYQKALAADLIIRRYRLQQTMQKMNIEACLLTTGVNVFYMTGRIYNGYYYLPAEGDPIHFVKRPADVAFDNTYYIRKPEQISEYLLERGMTPPKALLLETDVLPYSEMVRLMGVFGTNPEQNDAQNNIQNASYLMRRLRSEKTDFEVAQIRACARKHEAVYKLVPSVFRRGMTDIALQIEIEHLMRLHGSLGIFRSYGENMDIFMGSLLAGENAEAASPYDYALGGAGTSPMLPLGACGKVIAEGDTIMVDMAGNYTPWMTDITRVFSVGKTTEAAYKAHQVSCDIEARIVSIAKPGVACAELYNEALAMANANGLGDYYMGTEQQAKFVGHGVGLEINELPILTPRSREILVPNTVFALEPKFVIPGVGAVGIENTFLVTQTGIEKLTLLDEAIVEL